MDYEDHAARLAEQVTHPVSRWRTPVSTVPRHLLVPRWWENRDGGWNLRIGADDPEAWMEAAYSDTTLVTRVGALHADHAEPGQRTEGAPTSSSTLPSLSVQMLRHAMIADGNDVLAVTGSGYGTALLCRRLGEKHVTSVDVDPYLVDAAGQILDSIGLNPTMAVCDITGDLPATYDRIVSTVSVRPIPVSWLRALRPGGRLVTTIAGTGLIITADKTKDGGAAGIVEWDRAGFMVTRHGDDYAPMLDALFLEARDQDGEDIGMGRYPVLNVPEAWEIWSMVALAVPGIEYRTSKEAGRTTLWMLHADGSWARATGGFDEPPMVHQSGPRRLWNELERVRRRLLLEGSLPVYGAKVTITPDGETTLTRGAWSATL
ncbi:protein-L-isoaspartate(D-aspartate) O-methyltransferase [Streptomyces sp. NPDC096033]|uniref:protein-L-isoaspartate(D-aspartate) O-methyltransferase n=1 Tax=Streptomyces sp. NPDC096033 TaxID=3366071 RepID=UPI0037F61B8E